MKKIVLSSIAILAIAAIVSFNVSINKQSNALSEISLANVEALAAEDYNTKDGSSMYNCEVGSPNIFGESVRWCGSCEGAKLVITGTGKCKKN
jgi:uncharacterized Rmd1/YagE family protein